MRASEFIKENVVDMTKHFGTRKGMFHNPDAEPPVSRRTGESYVRFETQEHSSGKSASIIGVLEDGTKEVVSTSTVEGAVALAKAYNAGGYSDQRIERVPLGDVFKEDVVPFRPRDTRPDQMKYDDAVEDQTDVRSDLGVIPCPYCEDEWCNFDCDESQAAGFEDESE